MRKIDALLVMFIVSCGMAGQRSPAEDPESKTPASTLLSSTAGCQNGNCQKLMGGGVIGPLALSGTVSTIAWWKNNWLMTNASLLTTDGINLYFFTAWTQMSLWRLEIATGKLTEMANRYPFYEPFGITTDGTNLYIVDGGTRDVPIFQVSIATGVVTTLADYENGWADGTTVTARFNYPAGITTDGTNLYVADTGNNAIRQIVIATGAVTTIAGAPGSTEQADGTGAAAQFVQPFGITTDGTNVYVTDGNAIRQIAIVTGVVTTVATSPGSDFSGGIATDGTNLYLVDGQDILQVAIASGAMTTLAGGTKGIADGTGPDARFNNPVGIATNGTNLYVTDASNKAMRKIQ